MRNPTSNIGGPINKIASVDELQKIIITKQGIALDVREPDEYAYEHIAGTVSVPLSGLREKLKNLPRDKDLFIFCQTGVRTAQAVELLRSAGFPRVHAVSGGVEAWRDAGFHLKRAKGPIPIMRQVQIVAGTLALIGGLMPGARWVAVVVGAGLVCAGISGFCGMARVLSWLPWNRRKESPPSDKNSCGR